MFGNLLFVCLFVYYGSLIQLEIRDDSISRCFIVQAISHVIFNILLSRYVKNCVNSLMYIAFD